MILKGMQQQDECSDLKLANKKQPELFEEKEKHQRSMSQDSSESEISSALKSVSYLDSI